MRITGTLTSQLEINCQQILIPSTDCPCGKIMDRQEQQCLVQWSLVSGPWRCWTRAYQNVLQVINFIVNLSTNMIEGKLWFFILYPINDFLKRSSVDRPAFQYTWIRLTITLTDTLIRGMLTPKNSVEIGISDPLSVTECILDNPVSTETQNRVK